MSSEISTIITGAYSHFKYCLILYVLGVKPSLYAQYYFELRSLFFEIHGTSFDESSHWTLKPLSIIKARRLEDRSSNVWGKSKSKTSSSSSIRSDVSTESGSTHHVCKRNLAVISFFPHCTYIFFFYIVSLFYVIMPLLSLFYQSTTGSRCATPKLSSPQSKR